MSKDSVFWVGIDLHGASLTLAAFRGFASTPEVLKEMPPKGPALGRLIRRLQAQAPGSFLVALIDALYTITPEMLRSQSKISMEI